MIEVENPRVRLIAEPQIDIVEMYSYLEEVGGTAWFKRVFGAEPKLGLLLSGNDVPAAEALTEFCGRLCYKSWEPGLNKNVTKIREDRGEYLLNTLQAGHGSIFEHSNFTFVLHDVSRVLTAELNRHRAGVAISEQSLRYVRLDELRFRLPPVLKPETQKVMRQLVEHIEEELGFMLSMEGMDDPDLDFAHKKVITSALRRAAPLGLATEEVWTANVRTIRHVISMRTAEGAEEEIRIFGDQVARIMQRKCPLLFGDYGVVDGVWQTDNWKV